MSDPLQQSVFSGLERDQGSLFEDAHDSARDTVPSQYEDEFAELLDPFEAWLPGMFSRWVQGSEIGWARAAWLALGRQGLLDPSVDMYDAILDNAGHLVTLAAINHRFNGIRLGDGQGCEWVYQYPPVGGGHLGITETQLGRYAERRGVPDSGDGDDLATVLKEMAYILADDVYGALLAEWGENGLFTTLWMTSEEDATYPNTGADEQRIMNDPNADMLATYTWFTNERDI